MKLRYRPIAILLLGACALTIPPVEAKGPGAGGGPAAGSAGGYRGSQTTDQARLQQCDRLLDPQANEDCLGTRSRTRDPSQTQQWERAPQQLKERQRIHVPPAAD